MPTWIVGYQHAFDHTRANSTALRSFFFFFLIPPITSWLAILVRKRKSYGAEQREDLKKKCWILLCCLNYWKFGHLVENLLTLHVRRLHLFFPYSLWNCLYLLPLSACFVSIPGSWWTMKWPLTTAPSSGSFGTPFRVSYLFKRLSSIFFFFFFSIPYTCFI